ncbi:MAG: hypothetical protein O2930_14610 [Acidobacteria bacterium]|nr:hypothetical protein [Acidobacteriota bacterium]
MRRSILGLMDRLMSFHRGSLWVGVVLVVIAPLSVALLLSMWRSPFPINEMISLLEDAESSTPGRFFDPTIRSWYRPLFHLTLWGFWNGSGSLLGGLHWFRYLEVGSVLVLLLLFVSYLRPRTGLQAAAALLAVAVMMGMPGFRDNLEIPVLMTLVGMPMALLVWMLLEREHRWWYTPLILALTMTAIGYKEQGLVIAPVVVGAWWMGSPGARRTTTAVVVLAVLAYLAMRFSTRGHWALFEQDVGFLFGELGEDEAAARFGERPWILYGYSALATIGNILFSEPSRGTFVITDHALSGETRPWEWISIVSSTLMTALIAWWGVAILRRDWSADAWSAESRLFVILVLALGASGALGFNYARDRLGGMAVPFYAAASYFAVLSVAERAGAASLKRRATVALVLVMLAGAWQLRAVGTLHDVRLRAASTHRTWITSPNWSRVTFAHRPRYLSIMQTMTPQGTDPARARRPTYPEWFLALIGGG